MDADASRVDLGPTATTVSALSSLQTPVTWLLGGPANHRLEQTEFHTYEVQAFMTGLKLQPDGDYHIVIADSADQAKVMIVEIPDPRENPRLGSKFAEARSAVDQHLFRPTQVMRWIQPRRVKVTGVGFFDRLTDDQDGPAANGIELHPVLKITFE
jgi:hypothetical protein